MKKDFMFTSESVTPGHPDKLCDRISDAIVDRLLQQDPYARVITECAVSTGIVFLAARFEPNANVDFTNIARKVIAEVGYNRPDFNSKTSSILTSLEELPPDKIHNFDEKKLSNAEIEEIPPIGSPIGEGLSGQKFIIINTVITFVICTLFISANYLIVSTIVDSRVSAIGEASTVDEHNEMNGEGNKSTWI